MLLPSSAFVENEMKKLSQLNTGFKYPKNYNHLADNKENIN